MEYLGRLPTAIPTGKALVHNNVQPGRRPGSNGFRAYLVGIDDDRWRTCRVTCGCGWAPELGPHFRMEWDY